MQNSADLEQAQSLSRNERAKDGEHTVRAWLTVAGSFLVYFVSFGYMNSFGFFQDYYGRNDLAEYSASLVALIGSLQLGLMYLLGPVAGALCDAYGPKWLYLIAALGAVVSCLGVSFAQPGQIWQHFLSQGVLFGLTVAFGTYVALPLVGQHFRQKRAFAMGIVAAGSSAGGVCFPIMLSHLVPRIGFAWSVRVAALIFIVCYGLAVCISTSKLARQPLKSARDILDFGGFRDPRYTTLAVANVVGNLGLYVPFYYIEPYIAVHHPGASVSSYLLPLINGSSFFGRIIGGFVADHIGGLNLLYPMTVFCGIICLTMWLLAETIGLLIAFACLYGFCSGIFISVMPSVTAHISPEDKIGARLGAFAMWSAVGVFTGTPIGGAFITHGTRTEYEHLIGYTGATLTAAGLLLLVARVLCDRSLRVKW